MVKSHSSEPSGATTKAGKNSLPLKGLTALLTAKPEARQAKD